jgi:nicotinate-nucleotide adenylyltransferase
MTSHRRLGVLGGTFDPIHLGHLHAGDAAATALGLDEIRVIPAHDPPHRTLDPRASAFHRFALVALAIEDRPDWRLSDAELMRTGPSYTALTLKALHANGWSASQIFFILGSDAFAEIATWYDFPAVLDAAHFAVIARPGTTLDAAIARTPAVSERVRPVAAASRAALRVEPETGVFLIETSTPDVSSSDIRRRLAAGQSIDGLVPGAVARYIHTHHLYDSSAAVDDLHGKAQHKQEA